MRKLLGSLVVLVLAGLGFLAYVQFRYLTPERVKDTLQQQLHTVFSGQIKIGSASVSHLSSLVLSDLSLETPDGQEVFLTLKSAAAELDRWALLKGNVRLSEASLSGLDVQLKRGQDGRLLIERYLLASAPAPEPNLALCAAAGSLPTDIANVNFGINRLYLRDGKLRYVDKMLPITLFGVVGTMQVEGTRLEILEFRGKLYDRFMISMRGTAALDGSHSLDMKLDENPVEPLLASIPPVKMMMNFSHEVLKGMIALHLEARSERTGEDLSFKALFKDLDWTSSTLLGANIKAPTTEMGLKWHLRGNDSGLEGNLRLTSPVVKPMNLNQEAHLQDLSVGFEYRNYFLQLKSYTATIGAGHITGSGYFSLQGPKPDYELGFTATQVPAAELGIGGMAGQNPGAVVNAKGRFIPGQMALTQGDFKVGTSVVQARGTLRPDGQLWMLKDALVRIELEGSDLPLISTMGQAFRMNGRLVAEVAPSGVMPNISGLGRIEKCQLTLAPVNGPDGLALEIDSGAFQLLDGSTTLTQLRGRALGGQFAMRLDQGPSAVPGHARLIGEMMGLDAAALGRTMGLGNAVHRGRVRMSAALDAPLVTSPGSPTQLMIPRLSANVGVEGLEADVPAPMRSVMQNAPHLRYDRGQARCMWMPGFLDVWDIQLGGPSGSLVGRVRQERGRPPAGRLVARIGNGTTAYPINFGAVR